MFNRWKGFFGLSVHKNSDADVQNDADVEMGADPPHPQRKPHPIDVTDESFAHVVLNGNRLTVVDFWADWCQPCTIMGVHMSLLLEELQDSIVVAAMDVEENPQTSERYGVQGLPTIIFFRNGEEIDRQVGLLQYDNLKKRVQSLL